jgi:ABC-type Fe3+/spermidine/putrescine transport system ATPase subunit
MRALMMRPKVLLLDEPLGALDKKLREETQFELKALQARLGAAFMIVTHDQDEAMVLADRMAVMEAGRIVQVGTPREIYERPVSRQVAQFIGEANLFAAPGGWLAVRPERMWIALQAGTGTTMAGEIAQAGYLGDWTTYVVRLSGGQSVTVSRPNTGEAEAFVKGQPVFVGYDPAQAIELKA